MTRNEAYKYLLESQQYLRYQDNKKFPLKAKKYLPEETLHRLAALEAALQVDYKLCPVDYVIKEMRKLREMDITPKGKMVNQTIESCIKVLEHVMKYGVED